MENTVKKQFRAYLELRCQEQDLHAWFDPLSLCLSEEERSITVFFPHAFFATWFANGPQALFTYAVHDFFGQHYCVHYAQRYGYPKACNTAHVYTPSPNMTELDTNPNMNIDMCLKNAPTGHHAPKNAYSSRVGLCKDMDCHKSMSTNFDDSSPSHGHRFETFIANHRNSFPLTASREAAVASRTRRYNPVLLCGESGHGKSHLLGAMAYDLSLAMGPASVYCQSITDMETLYASAEKLVVRKHLMQREAFLLDDIHLLCDLAHLHDELICLFDYFLTAHKQMAFACTGRLALVRNISPALRSRLELGLILHLKEPDVDVRTRFIKKQCAQIGLKLTQEHITCLAQRCPSFRHISGILTKISAYVDMVKHNIENYELEKLLRHAESGRERKLSHSKIIEIVSEYFNIRPEDILGTKRHKNIVFARQIAMFLCRDLLACSFPTLGHFFNGKDHSTTMYSVNKIHKLQYDSKDTHKLVTELKKRCISHENDEP